MGLRYLLLLMCGVAGCGFFPEVGTLRQDDAGTASPTATTTTPPSGSSSSSSSGTSSSGSVDGDSGSDAASSIGPRTHVVNVGPGDRKLFQPSSLTIKVGDEVRWIFSSYGHNVVGQDGSWCSPNNTNCGSPPQEDRGATYSRTFTSAGTVNYLCAQHNDDNMKGVIIVQP